MSLLTLLFYARTIWMKTLAETEIFQVQPREGFGVFTTRVAFLEKCL